MARNDPLHASSNSHKVGPMIVTPENSTLLGDGLDHPESVCVTPDGTLYAGGEAGQLYRIEPNGSQQQVGTTGGFLLGLAADGNGRIYACDCAKNSLFRFERDGSVVEHSAGTSDRLFATPNHVVFDQEGNLYLTDSGDYWSETGTGWIAKIDPQGLTSLFHEGPFRFSNGIAIDPAHQWLYIAQSTASNIVRIPLDRPNGPIEITHQLPSGTVPDGLAFASDGRLVIGCYKPDAIYLGYPDGRCEVLCEDPTGELLSRPTNVALANYKLYIANLGGWHITMLDVELRAGPVYYPVFP